MYPKRPLPHTTSLVRYTAGCRNYAMKPQQLNYLHTISNNTWKSEENQKFICKIFKTNRRACNNFPYKVENDFD